MENLSKGRAMLPSVPYVYLLILAVGLFAACSQGNHM